MMSPTTNVCCKCGQPSTLIKSEEQSAKSKTQTSQPSPKHSSQSRTMKHSFCHGCKTCLRNMTIPRRHRVSKRTSSKSSDQAHINTLSLAPSSKVTKKARRSRWHRIKCQEYKKLRKMLPSLQQKENVSKLELIEETIRYIEELHSALVKRFKDRGLPPILNGLNINPHEIDGDSVRELIRKLLANANPGVLPPTRIENIRTTPSFALKSIKIKKL